MFEFKCVKCKENGNQFIGAADKQFESAVQLHKKGEELAAASRQIVELTSKWTFEQRNANELATKLQQSTEEIKQYSERCRQLQNEIERLNSINSELMTTQSAAGQSNIDSNGASMDIDPSSLILASYNESICTALNTSLENSISRIENNISTQIRQLIESLNDDSHSKKRKAPNDANGLNSIGSISSQRNSHKAFQISTYTLL